MRAGGVARSVPKRRLQKPVSPLYNVRSTFNRGAMRFMSFLGLIALLLVLGAAIVAGAVQNRLPRLQNILRGLLLSYLTILLILGAGEVYFRYFHADSDWAFTLARQNWVERYLKVNALGFRDRDWSPEDYAGKSTVLVLGDSFTFGWGVDHPEDRYSNALAELLGPDYAVINIGVPGSATREQIDVLRSYPLKTPDIIIWQYYLNDIDDAALSIGDQWWPEVPDNVPRWVEESYLANFVYWWLTPSFKTVETNDGLTYWEWAYRAYDNSGIWAIHEQEIRDMLAYIESTNARLIMILFPNLQDPVKSIAYLDRVAQAVREQGYTSEILPLYEDVAYIGTEAIIVSERDAHPNAFFHRYLGQRIYDVFFQPR